MSIFLTLSKTGPAGFLKDLSKGPVFFMKVLEKEGDSQYILQIQGRKILAKSDIKLKIGEMHKVRIEKEGRQWRLRVLNQSVEKISSLSAGVLDRESLLIEAFVKCGLAVRGIVWEKALRKSAALAKADKKILRLLVLFLDKGIDIKLEDLKSVMNLLQTNPQPENKDQEAEDSSAGQQEKKEEETGDYMLSSDLDENEKKRAWDHIRLFNHLKSSSGQWLLIPFREPLKGAEGSLRLFYQNNQIKANSAVISVNYSARNWNFFVEKIADDQKKISFLSDNSESAFKNYKTCYEDFKENLSKAGALLVDTRNEMDDFDGFSLEKAAQIAPRYRQWV